MLFITINVFEKLLPVHSCIPSFKNPLYVHVYVPLQNEVLKHLCMYNTDQLIFYF